jgi:DNA-binding NtrC family response regulator
MFRRIQLVGLPEAMTSALSQLLKQWKVRVASCAGINEVSQPSTGDAVVLLGLIGSEVSDAISRLNHLRLRTSGAIAVLALQGSEELAVGLFRAGVSDYFPASSRPEDVAACVVRLAAVDQHAAPQVGNPDGETIIGESPTMQKVRTMIANLASSDSTVLITGETGTGKELVARLIHRMSKRAVKPLVCVNCAAIPDSLFESELFGYERGAFTGALAASPGKLEQASGGTVFFDEIGDMAPMGQAKILRVMEDRYLYRLGGRTPVVLNMRVVAATNRDLDEMSETNQFRKDLYFRLNVGRIQIPPLRERRDDIPALATHYINVFNRVFSAHVQGINEEVLDSFLTYTWPGNVRELKNVIECVFVSKPSPRITYVDLPDWFKRKTTAPPAVDEKSRLMSALVVSKGNKSKAAEKLQWSRMTVYRKMKQYEIKTTSAKASE